jgi:hypothetical protein
LVDLLSCKALLNKKNDMCIILMQRPHESSPLCYGGVEVRPFQKKNFCMCWAKPPLGGGTPSFSKKRDETEKIPLASLQDWT